MTPQDFIAKWRPAALTERQAGQEHFIDLCRHPTPAEADPAGEWYCFEKGALKATGNPGFAAPSSLPRVRPLPGARRIHLVCCEKVENVQRALCNIASTGEHRCGPQLATHGLAA
jgi:hypothetical protein